MGKVNKGREISRSRTRNLLRRLRGEAIHVICNRETHIIRVRAHGAVAISHANSLAEDDILGQMVTGQHLPCWEVINYINAADPLKVPRSWPQTIWPSDQNLAEKAVTYMYLRRLYD